MIYYQNGLCTLHLADCREMLASIDADCVITDPPYSETCHTKAVTMTRSHGKKLVDFPSLLWPDLRAIIEQMKIKRWFIATMDYRHAWDFEKDPPPNLRLIRQGVWTKPNYVPQLSGDRPALGWEAVVIAHALGKPKWNGGGRSAVWNCTSAKTDYPTNKPLTLIRDFVALFTDPTDLVLDPFCGSGTTCVACCERGVRSIGIDVREAALELAAKRLDSIANQPSLFEARS